MKRILVVYASRTGRTETVARELAAILGADLERIQEKHARSGLPGYLRSAFEALLGVHPVIARSTRRPQAYDVIVVGTPVWFWNMSSPVRSYLRRHRTHMHRLAVFCTQGGSGGDKVLEEMARLVRQPALAKMVLRERDVFSGHDGQALLDFSSAIRHRGLSARAPDQYQGRSTH